MTLGEALRSYRREHRLLQKEIAGTLNISLKHYSGLENGHAHASSKVMKRICELTGIAISYSFAVMEKSARYRAHRRIKKRRVRIM